MACSLCKSNNAVKSYVFPVEYQKEISPGYQVMACHDRKIDLCASCQFLIANTIRGFILNSVEDDDELSCFQQKYE